MCLGPPVKGDGPPAAYPSRRDGAVDGLSQSWRRNMWCHNGQRQIGWLSSNCPIPEPNVASLIAASAVRRFSAMTISHQRAPWLH